jgi:hypothetical protein
VPEGALYNPAAGVATVIPGGILDTGTPSTTPPASTASGTAPAGSFQFYQEANEAGLYDQQSTPNLSKETQPTVPQTTLEAMQGAYVDKLGRTGDPENVMAWVNAVNNGDMTFEEAVAGIANSAEGQAYAASQAAIADGTATDKNPRNPNYGPNITAAIQAIEGNLYSAEEMADHFGISLDDFNALTDQYGGYTNPNADANGNGDGDDDTGMPAGPGSVDAPPSTILDPDEPPKLVNTNFNPIIQQYYQELFNRQAQQPGLDYFTGRLRSGALKEEALRDAIIAGASGTDKLYYDSSQAYGPVFDATYSLFGRRPARGSYNPQTGQLEGGFGQYRRQLDAGNLTSEQLRRNLVQLAYDRGPQGGRSSDYQYYLDTLGIDRSDNPFLQDDGTYRNIPYGLNLSEYQQDPGMPAPPPGGNIINDFPPPGVPGGNSPVPGGGLYQRPDGSYGGGGHPLGKGGGMPGRMPGQYITGNQLYSGLPYGMTVPMQPFNYGFSSQYMPNRGLMSGYSTGFGPYGGFQRPRFGGGKGGMMRPMPYGMGGGKGGFGY